MPVEMGIWRIDGKSPRRLTVATLPSERALEDFLEQNPALLRERLLVVGRQVRSPLRVDCEQVVDVQDVNDDNASFAPETEPERSSGSTPRRSDRAHFRD